MLLFGGERFGWCTWISAAATVQERHSGDGGASVIRILGVRAAVGGLVASGVKSIA